MGGKDNQSIWVLYWYCSTNITIWLFNIAMENNGKSPFLIGKPSISMGYLYHGYVSHNQRVFFPPLFLPGEDLLISELRNQTTALTHELGP